MYLELSSKLCKQACRNSSSTYIVDVLWGQPIKLAQVASTSELLSSKSFPLISAGPQKPQKLTASKIKYEKFGPNILIPG